MIILTCSYIKNIIWLSVRHCKDSNSADGTWWYSLYSNSLSIRNKIFNINNQFRKFYLNSKLYDKKISKNNEKNLSYKPSPHLLSSLINYQKKKIIVRFVILL